MALFKSQIEILKSKYDVEGLIKILYCAAPWGSKEAKELVILLGSIKDQSLLYPLVVALKHQAMGVRLKAIETLEIIGDKRAIAPIITVHNNDKEVIVRNAACKALERLGWHPEYTTEEVYLLLASKKWDDLISQYSVPKKISFLDEIRETFIKIIVFIGSFLTLALVVGGGIYLLVSTLSSGGLIDKVQQSIINPDLKKAFVGLFITVLFSIPYLLSRGQSPSRYIAVCGGSLSFVYALYHIISWVF